jgi:biotin operon repressor
MAVRIVNLANPDEAETLCATVDEAEATLAEMIERLESQGYRIEIRHDSGEDYPQYAVYDHSDAWVGLYTIELQ